jgi:hypothetical protein
MPVVPLNTSVLSTFAANPLVAGTQIAKAMIGPQRAGEEWRITTMVTSTTSAAPSKLYLYKNGESPSSLVDSTFNGNRDTSACDVILTSSDKLIAVWADGDLGALATLVVYGQVRI